MDLVLVNKILHKKKCILTDKISKTMNDTDSDGGSFSELWHVWTKFANQLQQQQAEEEKGTVQSEPERGRQRSGRAIPNCSYTDLGSRCEEQIQKIQKLAFSGVTWTNKNFPVTKDSSPLDAIAKFFSTELFKHIQNETNWYAKQQIRKKKQRGPLNPKFVFA
jgi:hypothetical protein